VDCPVCKEPILLSQPVRKVTKSIHLDLPGKLKVFELLIGEVMESEELLVHAKCMREG